MAARVPPPPPAPGSFASYLPRNIRSDGPYGEYVDQVYSVYVYVRNFVWNNLTWMKEAGGQKSLLIKVPEAIVSIAKRITPATHIPGRMINFFAETLAPLHRLGACAKNFVAFSDAGSKFPAMFDEPDRHYRYVVKDAANKNQTAQMPYDTWGQRACRAEAIVSWSLSVSECGNYLWKSSHPLAEGKAPFTDAAVWMGRYMSVKSLCFEGWFLYQTWWCGSHLRYDDTTKQYVPIKGTTTITNEYLVGSLLKISLSTVCLSLDLFQTFAPKENKPIWLETAIFWMSIAPTFITPVAMRYWPNMVTTPLYAKPAG